MKITVRGGKVLLVIGGGATARVEGKDKDIKAILVASEGSLLQLPGSSAKEPTGAYFTNGAIVDLADTDSTWLVEALQFLGFTVHKKENKREQEKKRRHRT